MAIWGCPPDTNDGSTGILLADHCHRRSMRNNRLALGMTNTAETVRKSRSLVMMSDEYMPFLRIGDSDERAE